MNEAEREALESAYDFLNGHHEELRCCGVSGHDYVVYEVMRNLEEVLDLEPTPLDSTTKFDEAESERTASWYEEAWLDGWFSSGPSGADEAMVHAERLKARRQQYGLDDTT